VNIGYVINVIEDTAEHHRALLQPLMDFYTERGRLPKPDEVRGEPWEGLQSQFGNIRRAFKIILQATTSAAWLKIADKRRQGLPVYPALATMISTTRPSSTKRTKPSPPITQATQSLPNSASRKHSAARSGYRHANPPGSGIVPRVNPHPSVIALPASTGWQISHP
jgi:hypothetical protein